MSAEGERRKTSVLSEDQIDEIAERAADKAIIKMEERLYQQVGRKTVKSLLIFVGMATTALGVWLESKGLLPK